MCVGKKRQECFFIIHNSFSLYYHDIGLNLFYQLHATETRGGFSSLDLQLCSETAMIGKYGLISCFKRLEIWENIGE